MQKGDTVVISQPPFLFRHCLMEAGCRKEGMTIRLLASEPHLSRAILPAVSSLFSGEKRFLLIIVISAFCYMFKGLSNKCMGGREEYLGIINNDS